MNIYTNDTRTKFFKTNKFIDDLTPVKIEGLDDALSNYPKLFSLGALLDQQSICVGENDELIALDNMAAEDADVLNIDFTKDLSYAEIADKYLSSHEMVSSKLLIIEDLGEWFPQTAIWEGDIETISLDPSDGDKLIITIDHDAASVETKIENAG